MISPRDARSVARRSRPLARLAWIAVVATLGTCTTACSRCHGDPGEKSTRAASFEVAPGQLTAPWRWEEGPAEAFSFPSPCKRIGQAKRFRAPTEGVFFLAVPGNVSELAVSTGDAASAGLTATRGLVSLEARPGAVPVRDVPWIHLLAPPVLASDAGRWLALLHENDSLQGTQRVWLWREQGSPQLLGAGEGFAAVDARCDRGMCVLLTTRHTQVAAPGATAWFGAIDAPADQFVSQDLVPEDAKGRGEPVGIAAWDPGASRVTAAIETSSELVFLEATRDQTKRLAAIPREDQLLDVVRTRDAVVAVFARGNPDPRGCVPGGVQVVVAVPGRDPSLHFSPALPTSGYARPLQGGAFLTWISAVNCLVPGRKVVNGLVLRPDGTAVSAPMGIGNADGHAVSTRGDEVHVWLRDTEGVTWVRARCDMAEARPDGGVPPTGSR